MIDNSQGNDSTQSTPSLSSKDLMRNSREMTLGSREPFAPRGMQSSQFQPGDMIDGRYQVMSVIGSGGFGCVYRVHQILLKKNFALKTLNPVNMSEVTMLRLRKEAQTAGRLEHENLVKAIDFGMIDFVQPYLVMDLVEGPTLAEYLRAHGRLSVEKALEIFLPLTQGVAYAHGQGVVHRDLKPSNVILATDRTRQAEFVPKIVDFGIAKIRFADESQAMSLTTTGDIFGTPLYMSPEQCSGQAVDNRSDIYSLGCMLFEALTGAPPFSGRNALEVMMAHGAAKLPTLKEGSLGESFPAELERIVSSMLSKSPDERYSNAQKIADDLFFLQKGDFDRVSTIAQTGAVIVRREEKKQNRQLLIGTALACFTIGAALSYLVTMALKPVSKTTETLEAAPDLGTMMASDVEDALFSQVSKNPEKKAFVFPPALIKNTSGHQVPVAIETRPSGLTIAQWLDEKDKNDNLHVKLWGDFFWWEKQKSAGGSKLEEVTIPTDGKPFEVPKDARIFFWAGMKFNQYPYMWGRFRSTDLTGVIIAKNACSYNDSTVNQYIYSCAFQEKLQFLTLDLLTVSPRALHSIGSLSSLRWLDLKDIFLTGPNDTSVDFTGKDVQDFAVLPKLKVLRLEQCETVTPVLKILAKNNDLVRLSVAHDKCTDEDMQLIGQLDKLQVLDVRGSAIDGDKLLSYLSNLKHLKTLLVDLTVLEKMTPENLSALKKKVEVIPVHAKKHPPTQEVMENIGHCVVEDDQKPSDDLFNCLTNDPSQVGL